MDRGDYRLGAVVRDVVMAARIGRPGRGRPAELPDVGAGDEAAPVADQHHRLYRRVGVAAVDRGGDAFGHAGREGIDRRVVDGNDPDPIDILETDQLAVAHSSFLRYRRRLRKPATKTG